MTAADGLRIVPSIPADAAPILALRRLAFESEARRYNHWNIPPLTQTLAEMQVEYADCLILKGVTPDGVVAGSVRGRLRGEVCEVGRLVVHPEYRRRGIARRLMQELEQHFPAARRFELYTGARSPDNIQLYLQLGYAITGRVHPEGQIEFVRMEKQRS